MWACRPCNLLPASLLVAVCAELGQHASHPRPTSSSAAASCRACFPASVAPAGSPSSVTAAAGALGTAAAAAAGFTTGATGAAVPLCVLAADGILEGGRLPVSPFSGVLPAPALVFEGGLKLLLGRRPCPGCSSTAPQLPDERFTAGQQRMHALLVLLPRKLRASTSYGAAAPSAWQPKRGLAAAATAAGTHRQQAHCTQDLPQPASTLTVAPASRSLAARHPARQRHHVNSTAPDSQCPALPGIVAFLCLQFCWVGMTKPRQQRIRC